MRQIDRILRRPALPQPKRQASLDLNFLLGKYAVNNLSKSFADIITFTRPSATTRVNPLGLIETVAANVPCIDHSPVNLATGTGAQTLALAKDRTYAVTAVGGTVAVAGAGVNVSQMGAASGVIQTPAGAGTVDVTFTPSGASALHVREVLGLSVWEQRTNLLIRSSEFDDASWAKANSSISANSIIAPDGTLTADKIVENTSTSSHGIYRLPGFGVATYTYSVYAKAGERSSFQIEQESGGNARFTLTGNGTALALGANSVSIVPVGNGWYRCSSTFTVTGGFGLYLNMYNGSTIYTGDGSSGIYVWGSQTEVGSFATSYIPTTSAQVTRAADVPVMNSLSPWFKQSEGTFVVEFDQLVGANTQAAAFDLWQDTVNKLSVRHAQALYMVGSVTVGADGNTFPQGGVHKRAVSYGGLGLAFARDGVLSASGGSQSLIPAPSKINLGATDTTLLYLNGHLRKLKYIKKALPSQLASLTA